MKKQLTMVLSLIFGLIVVSIPVSCSLQHENSIEAQGESVQEQIKVADTDEEILQKMKAANLESYEAEKQVSQILFSTNGGYNEADYNYGNVVQAVYPGPAVNLTLNKRASASKYLSHEAPSKAVNGTYLSLNDKWCTGYGGGRNQWLEVDLGKYYYFDRWVVINGKHTDRRMFTKYYKLQIKKDGVWQNVSYVHNRQEKNETDIILDKQYITRYVRLYVMIGDFDDAARIHEFQIYNSRGYVAHPGDILLTESSTPDHAGLAYDQVRSIEAQARGVVNETIGKWHRYSGGFWVKRVKNATFQTAVNVANYGQSKLGYSYNFDFSDYKYTRKFHCTSLVYRSWRSGGGVDLDSALWFPPLTVSDIDDDSSAYRVYSE